MFAKSRSSSAATLADAAGADFPPGPFQASFVPSDPALVGQHVKVLSQKPSLAVVSAQASCPESAQPSGFCRPASRRPLTGILPLKSWLAPVRRLDRRPRHGPCGLHQTRRSDRKGWCSMTPSHASSRCGQEKTRGREGRRRQRHGSRTTLHAKPYKAILTTCQTLASHRKGSS